MRRTTAAIDADLADTAAKLTDHPDGEVMAELDALLDERLSGPLRPSQVMASNR